MEDKIKIVLADDEVLFRKGILFLLEREPNFEVLQEASDGEELLQYLRGAAILPDIILMDLKMPNLNGVESTKLIRKDYPDIKIIALTSYNTPLFIANMIQEGAASYLIKNVHPTEMIRTVNEVADRGFYYSQDVLKVIRETRHNLGKKIHSSLSEELFTEREKKILELICAQYSTVEIADKICVSPRTIDGHRIHLLAKTKTKNVAGLVVYVIRNGIVSIDNL